MELFNPGSEEFQQNPYPYYRIMRERHPVYRTEERLPSGTGAWYLFRHADVSAVLKDPRFVREQRNALPASPSAAGGAGTQVESAATPSERAGAPLDPTGTRVDSAGNPAEPAGIPGERAGTPVDPMGARVEPVGTPVDSAERPVESAATPVDPTGTRVDSAGNPAEPAATGGEPARPAPTHSFWQMNSQWMLFRDPPDHTRLRGLVNKAFTPRMVEGLADRVAAIADELLRQALAAGGMDLIADYAFPLPVVVIAELLGVPAEDRYKFKAWTSAMTAAMDVIWNEEIERRASEATAEVSAYMAHIIAQRRRDPGDDLLSALIHAREKDDKLSEAELIAMAVLLLVAGHETTVNLIGNGAFALLQNPDQLAFFKNNPSRAPQAVEELLRYDAPVQLTTRWAAADVEIGGQTIRRGDEVITFIGAANRDPEVYDDPDRLDLTRESIRHLSFGGGIHYCVGAPLARREGQIALTTLFARAPSIRLIDETPVYRRGLVFRGLTNLSVSFG